MNSYAQPPPESLAIITRTALPAPPLAALGDPVALTAGARKADGRWSCPATRRRELDRRRAVPLHGDLRRRPEGGAKVPSCDGLAISLGVIG